MRTPLKFLIAFLAGATNALAFAPFGWMPLYFVSIGILFGLWLRDTRYAAAFGFLFGLGMFGVGTSWMYVSLNTFGGMPPLLAGLCILMLTAAMSLYPAAVGWLQNYFSRWHAAARVILILPAIWLLMEWLRGWLLTGFPWLTGGYAMIDTPLAALAPLAGVYGVGLAALVTLGVVMAVLMRATRTNIFLTVLVAFGWASGAYFPDTVKWTKPDGAEISVAIIQNNIALNDKWSSARRNEIIAEYVDRSAQYDVDLIVWPEAAVPDYLDRLSDDFHRRLREHPADFIVGVLTRSNSDGVQQHFNSIAAIGTQTNLYHKQHLVPFGEFLPVKWLFAPLLKLLQIPMSDFSRGQAGQPPLRAAGNTFAASVCYEDAFPQIWRDQVPASGVLLNLSEDSWFGDSPAPHQRLQMARFRALESGRPMIRSSNNGLSSVINRRGKVETIAPQFAKAVVTATVQPRTGITPYTAYGNLPALLAAVLLGGLGLLLGGRKLR